MIRTLTIDLPKYLRQTNRNKSKEVNIEENLKLENKILLLTQMSYNLSQMIK